MTGMKTYTKIKGLTLLELLIVISIVSILAFVAVPAMDSTMKTNSVRSLQRTFLSAFAYARGEAVARNKLISICPSADEATCSDDPLDWSAGWIVFEDNGAGTEANASNGTRDAIGTSNEERLLRASKYIGSSTVRVFNPADSANLLSVTWNYRGYTEYRNDTGDLTDQRAVVVVCPGDADNYFARGFMLERTGRVNLTRAAEDYDGVHQIRYESTGNSIGEDQDGAGQSISDPVSC